VDALLRHDPQASLFELGVDLAGQIAAGGVGLDDGKRAFDGLIGVSYICAAGASMGFGRWKARLRSALFARVLGKMLAKAAGRVELAVLERVLIPL
jgi:hypothetical protein